MTAALTNDLPREEHLDQVLLAYLKAAESGEQPDPQEWLSRYPELAAELRDFFADQDKVERVAGPLRAVAYAHYEQLGDYHIVRELGRGGMGIVYEAEQISLKRRVALKVLPFAATLDSRQLQRFKNEAQAAAQLHHTNIVPVFSVGCERGVHYYAMQFIEGHTLAALIADLRKKDASRRGAEHAEKSAEQKSSSAPLREIYETPTIAAFSTVHSTKDPAFFRTVASLGIQAAEALEHAHNEGIVHRDIKPGNLLVDVKGNLWITDFGLARLGTDAGLTVSGDLLGTLRYMSPEQALAKRVTIDHRTDIYSLGATLYELLTLEPAIKGDDREEILRRIAFDEPKPPRRISKAIPAELETIVLKAMGKSPEERYGTAQEMADDVRRWLENKPIKAKRPSSLHRVRKFARRHEIAVRAAVIASFIGLLLTSLTFGFGMFKVKAEQQRTETQLRTQIEAKKNLELMLWHARLLFADRTHRSNMAQRLLPLNLDYLRDWTVAFKDQEIHRLPRHSTWCIGVAFSPDGRLIASGQGWNNGTVRVFDAATFKELQSFRYPKGTGALTFTPDSRRIACAAYRCVAVRQLDTGDEVVTRIHQERAPAGNIMAMAGVHNLALSPDGRHVASAGYFGKVRVSDTLDTADEPIDAETQRDNDPYLGQAWGGRVYRVARELFDLDGYFTVAWSPDGRYIASGEHLAGSGVETVVTLCDAATGSEVMRLQRHVGTISSLAFSPDGRYLASADLDGLVQVSDIVAGKAIMAWHGGGKHDLPSWWLASPGWQISLLNRIIYSPDGRYLVSTGLDGIVRIWHAQRERLGELAASIDGRMGPIFGLAFSPDGRRLAAAGGFGDHGIVKIWDKKMWEK